MGLGAEQPAAPSPAPPLCPPVPGPPVGILFPEVRTTSVRLVWQPPAAPNGIILGKAFPFPCPGHRSRRCKIQRRQILRWQEGDSPGSVHISSRKVLTSPTGNLSLAEDRFVVAQGEGEGERGSLGSAGENPRMDGQRGPP